ncbi:rCG26856, isoform CRA_e [Rattus norvegicus]|uniref:RCG26856, isoform CRA_e n=1 Tax=Rattus norvegicus TaxID=10116 RepID=A6HPG1_RAT|nr:rCG26856, isoform CRA_e [Rattus norvegicus]
MVPCLFLFGIHPSVFIVSTNFPCSTAQCHASVLSEERNRDSCQEPASKAPTRWDHIHAAFPSSALHHGPVCCVLCPVSVSSYLSVIQPSLLSLSAVLLSLRFPAFYLTLGSAGKPVSDVAG